MLNSISFLPFFLIVFSWILLSWSRACFLSFFLGRYCFFFLFFFDKSMFSFVLTYLVFFYKFPTLITLIKISAPSPDVLSRGLGRYLLMNVQRSNISLLQGMQVRLALVVRQTAGIVRAGVDIVLAGRTNPRHFCGGCAFLTGHVDRVVFSGWVILHERLNAEPLYVGVVDRARHNLQRSVGAAHPTEIMSCRGGYFFRRRESSLLIGSETSLWALMCVCRSFRWPVGLS